MSGMIQIWEIKGVDHPQGAVSDSVRRYSFSPRGSDREILSYGKLYLAPLMLALWPLIRETIGRLTRPQGGRSGKRPKKLVSPSEY